MEDYSELKKLDDVLKYFIAMSDSQPLTFWDIQHPLNATFQLDRNEIFPILSKLVNDKYLSVEIVNMKRIVSKNNSYTMPERLYFITFEGKFFIQIGGYVKKAESNLAENGRLEKLESDQMAIQTNMQRLTFWIAIGAIVASAYYLYYLIIPIYDHFVLKK